MKRKQASLKETRARNVVDCFFRSQALTIIAAAGMTKLPPEHSGEHAARALTMRACNDEAHISIACKGRRPLKLRLCMRHFGWAWRGFLFRPTFLDISFPLLVVRVRECVLQVIDASCNLFTFLTRLRCKDVLQGSREPAVAKALTE